MGAFQRKYTLDQHRGVQNARLNEKLPYKRIRELSTTGKLYGLAPFEMPQSTMERTVADERRRRRVADYHPEAIDPHTAALDIHKWLQSQVCQERDDINGRIGNGKLKGEEKLVALRSLAKTQQEIDRLQVKPSKPTKKDEDQAPEPKRKRSPTIDAITRMSKQQRATVQNHTPPQETEDGESSDVVPSEAAATTTEREGEARGRVPSHSLPESLAGAVPLEQPDPAPTVAETVT